MSAARKNNINFAVIKKSFIGTFNKYAVFKGRARRQEFWIFFFCTWILGLIPVIGTIISLITFIPSIAVGVRRLHDTNHSGLWLLFLIYIPLPIVVMIYIFAFVAGGTGIFSVRGADFVNALGTGLGILVIFLLLLPILGIILFFIWAAKPGTAGKNKYGQNPKK